MRANREAFDRWRIRPRMLTGNASRDISVDVLGMRSAAPFFLAPLGVLSIAHEEAEVAVAQARPPSSGVPLHALERRDALDRAGGGDRCAALVPALLGERPRHLRELRAPRGSGRATARSSSRSTRSPSAGGRATCGSPTCRSSRARAAGSTSPTRCSSRSSTRAPRRTCSPPRRRCSRRSRTSA